MLRKYEKDSDQIESELKELEEERTE